MQIFPNRNCRDASQIDSLEGKCGQPPALPGAPVAVMLPAVMTLRNYLRLSLCALLFGLPAAMAAAQAGAPQHARIAAHPDLTPATRLAGHLPDWVTPAADAGSVPDETPLRLTLLLARAPALQSAFEQLLADQQDPQSAGFHQWLTPAQIGEQYGPTPDDIHAITSWLTARGLTVQSVSPSRTFIETSGSAFAVAQAFSTSFHRYRFQSASGTELRLSATQEPAIPLAFAGVISAVHGLTDIPLRPHHRSQPAEPRKGNPLSQQSLAPLSSNSTNTTHYLFPGDVAKIYDITPVTAAGNTGAGVKVAIVAQSDITNADINAFLSLAALPSKTPNVVLVPGSTDPGLVAGDEDESTLDVTRVLSIATGSQADLVVAAGSAGGVDASMQYEVNTLVDPVMSVSYGACEKNAGPSAVNFYNALFSQGAAEGISIFISSGDSASSGCSSAFHAPTATEALNMGNFLCSSSYVTCVGGTEFADASSYSTYWSPTNSATGYTSAFGYIPEGAWNEPTNSSGSFIVAGSGSGPSAYITKPSWQTGAGVPADGFRDTPDVAFSASGHDGYYACLAYLGTSYDCSKGGGIIFSGTSASAPDMAAIAALLVGRLGSQGNLNPTLYSLAATTPAAFHDATPASSGVANCSVAIPSLCNNSVAAPSSLANGVPGYPLQAGYDLVTGLGSLDVANFFNAAISRTRSLTSLAVVATPAAVAVGGTATFTATISSSSAAANPTGTIQFFSNGVAFGSPVLVTHSTATSPPLVFATAGTFGITAAYSGDGSFAASTSSSIALTVSTNLPSTVAVNAFFATISEGAIDSFGATVASAAASSSVVPTGTVRFYSNGVLLGMATSSNGFASFLSSAFTPAGTYAITGVYSGDPVYAPSTSPVFLLTVKSLAPSATSVTVSPTTIAVGQKITVTASVSATAAGSAIPTGTVVIFFNGQNSTVAASLVNGVATVALPIPTAGSVVVTAVYQGDTSHTTSVSPGVTVTVTPLPSTTTLTLSANPLVAGSPETLTATASVGAGILLYDTVQFFSGATSLGKAAIGANNTATLIPAAAFFSTAGSYSVTAVYSGNAVPGYASSTSAPVTLTVTPALSPVGLSIGTSVQSLTLSAGATTGNTVALTVSTGVNYSGSVTLSCAVAYTGGAATFPPTCSLSNPALTFSSASSAVSTLTVNTTVPHAVPPVSIASGPPFTGPFAALSLAALLTAFLPWPKRRLLRSRLFLIPLPLLLAAALLSVSGCGSSSSSLASPTAATPVGTSAGAYTITLVATPDTGSAVQTVLRLTVQ